MRSSEGEPYWVIFVLEGRESEMCVCLKGRTDQDGGGNVKRQSPGHVEKGAREG